MGKQSRAALAAAFALLVVASSLVVPAAALAGPSEPLTIAAPSLIEPIDGASSSANPVLRWSANNDALSYKVEVFAHADLSGPTACNGETSPPHFLCPDLRPNVYYWHVRAVGIQNQLGPWSASRQFIVLPGPTTAPRLIAPANGANLTYPDELALLRWTAIPDAGHYQVQFSDAPSFPGPEPDLAYALIDTEALRVPLGVVGKKQYWRVRAVSIGQVTAGPWSAARSFTVHWPDADVVGLAGRRRHRVCTAVRVAADRGRPALPGPGRGRRRPRLCQPDRRDGYGIDLSGVGSGIRNDTSLARARDGRGHGRNRVVRGPRCPRRRRRPGGAGRAHDRPAGRRAHRPHGWGDRRDAGHQPLRFRPHRRRGRLPAPGRSGRSAVLER